MMAPPRSRKTALLARRHALAGPGAATSTKPDLFGLTSGLRSRLGPVHVFNPQRRGGLPSSFGWDPLPGCQDPAVAIRRADAFAEAVEQKGVEKGDWFGRSAPARYLRALFCAAALGGRDLLTVARWAAGLGDHRGAGDPAPGTGASSSPASWSSCAARPARRSRPSR